MKTASLEAVFFLSRYRSVLRAHISRSNTTALGPVWPAVHFTLSLQTAQSARSQAPGYNQTM